MRSLHLTHLKIEPCPSAGGSRGYSMSQQYDAMEILDSGEEKLDLFECLRIVDGYTNQKEQLSDEKIEHMKGDHMFPMT